MSTINPRHTSDEIMEVPCIVCSAQVRERCWEMKDDKATGNVMLGFHTERLELREKYPTLPFHEKLTAEDKALIVHYAFVIMADSVAAKSEIIFGKHIPSVDVQRFFCSKAIEEARKDGMLK